MNIKSWRISLNLKSSAVCRGTGTKCHMSNPIGIEIHLMCFPMSPLSSFGCQGADICSISQTWFGRLGEVGQTLKKFNVLPLQWKLVFEKSSFIEHSVCKSGQCIVGCWCIQIGHPVWVGAQFLCQDILVIMDREEENSKFEQYKFWFQRIPWQDIGKLL